MFKPRALTQLVTAAITAILFTGILSAQEITLDHVDNSWDDNGITRLVPNCDPTFYIRAKNTYNKNCIAFSHGFTINSTAILNATSVILDTVTLSPSWDQRFFTGPVFFDDSLDGFYPELVGYNCVGKNADIGLEPGFNEIILSIKTSGVPVGESICIDSSFFPTVGTWVWTPSYESSIVPSWDGPHCFEVKAPDCPAPSFVSLPDTIRANTCALADYQFEVTNICDTDNEYMVLLDGPGNLTNTGTELDVTTYDWSWNINGPLNGKTITVGLVSPFGNCGEPSHVYTIPISVITSEVGDVDKNCQFDISDLLFLIDYFFGENPPMIDIQLSDCNNDGIFDISDLLMMVDHFFGNGPACISG